MELDFDSGDDVDSKDEVLPKSVLLGKRSRAEFEDDEAEEDNRSEKDIEDEPGMDEKAALDAENQAEDPSPTKKAKKQTFQGRNFCFTMNSPEEDNTSLWCKNWVEERKAKFHDPNKIRYIVGGYEIGEETKRWHIQGYFDIATMAGKWSLKKAISFFGDKRIHIEHKGRFSTRNQARDYCLKECKEGFQIGKWIKGAGARTDIEQLVDAVKEGKSNEWLAEEMPVHVIRHHKGIEKLQSWLGQKKPQPREPLQLVCYYGPSRTGKTTRVDKICKELVKSGLRVYRKPYGKWWPEYSGEEVVVFEDFTGTEDHYPYAQLLNVWDDKPCSVDVKNSEVALKANYFLVTSNRDPREWYAGHYYNKGQLAQRFSRPNCAIHKCVPLDDREGEKGVRWPKEKVHLVDRSSWD